jgi:predicted transcriptional regulator
MKKEDQETPVSQLILETTYLLQKKKDEKIIDKLEEWGLIEAQGRYKKRMKRFTPKGIKKALNISLAMEDEN